MHDSRIDPYSRAARRRRVAGAAALAVTGIVFWAALLASGAFLRPPPFQATLTQTATGIDEAPGSSGMLFANISLHFARPGTIDPANFVITVISPSGPLYTWDRTTYSSATLPYYSNECAHWVATFPNGAQWTGFTAWVTDPGGTTVGAVFCPGPWNAGGPSSSVDSGSTITLTFPGNVTSVAGYSVVVTDQGAPGSVASALT